MIAKLLLAGLLMAICVVVHATGLVGTMRWLSRSPALAQPRFWPSTWLLIRIAALLILLHLVEIFCWALLFAWGQALPDLYDAIYFSSVTYTTTGYGDLVLPQPWRLVGGVEALTGILMCGLSTGFFFAAVGRIYDSGWAKRTTNGV
jgi:hypothetical protein